jgi:hypothetical protein
VQVISGKFLGDFQRHYDEKGYKIFDWVFETNPLAYFTALVGLSKIVRVPADVSHRGGSKPRSVDEILQKVSRGQARRLTSGFGLLDVTSQGKRFSIRDRYLLCLALGGISFCIPYPFVV